MANDRCNLVWSVAVHADLHARVVVAEARRGGLQESAMTESILHVTTIKQIRCHLIGNMGHPRSEHLVFMCDEIEKFEVEDPLKAARWLGYAICLCELITGVSNDVTRTWVRHDVKNHNCRG
jgi:hypothetical protein